MPRLRQRRAQRQQLQGTPPAPGHLDFISDRVFDPPLTGLFNGQIVKVHERGNTTGMSATLWISDQRGVSSIVSLGQVTMLDANYIAPTADQFDGLLEGLQLEPTTK